MSINKANQEPTHVPDDYRSKTFTETELAQLKGNGRGSKPEFSASEYDELRSPSFRRSASRSAVNRLKAVELHHYNCKSCAQPTSEPVDSAACKVQRCQECNLGITVTKPESKRVLKPKTRKPITKKEDLEF
ncbi:hypothetical protein CMI37_31990 [Candidatus Pacearchaeota archaeon]|nr:hypothetical protein [Candidatus Pacearchaeota archaeon]|tara:strand:+ start:642 stop:1037 length:396 start_codon:yes stop_codon:yes gene_type:complete